jgi:hypothetical protein
MPLKNLKFKLKTSESIGSFNNCLRLISKLFPMRSISRPMASHSRDVVFLIPRPLELRIAQQEATYIICRYTVGYRLLIDFNFIYSICDHSALSPPTGSFFPCQLSQCGVSLVSTESIRTDQNFEFCI